MCISNTLAIPSAEATEAFGQRMIGMLNQACLSMMVSIGHRTGLFDTMAAMPPASSAEIADRARLNERYVREWLGAMTVGRVVDYDPDSGTYQLPAEHAALLTRAAVPNNLASMMQWISVLGGVETRIVECFQGGGGLRYEDYERFHDAMAEESAQTVVAALTTNILPLAPGLRTRLEAGIDVLDIGCGEGRAMLALAEEYPQSRFAGYDFCEEAVAVARRDAQQRNLENVRFEVRDVATLNEPNRYDLVTAFDAIHDQRDPQAVLTQVAAALRKEGIFLIQDIDTSSLLEENLDHPVGPLLYTISTMHCMSVSLGQGGAGLGTCWGRQLARQMLAEAGFAHVSIHRLPHDVQNCYYVARKQ